VRAKRSWVAVAVGLVALASPAPSGAATILGETFTPPNACNDGTFLQAAPSSYAAPTPGVITSWSFQAASPAPLLKFKMARPVGGDNFTIVGESGPEQTVANQLNVYSDVRISVQPGDVPGVYLDNGPCLRFGTPEGYLFAQTGGDHTPSEGAQLYTTFANVQLDVSAVLEPDCDSDGFGDETQDPELPLGDACGKGNRTLAFDANKNKVKRGKQVTLTGQVNQVVRQGPCESIQLVELQRKRPSQAAFATVEQLQTDVDGSFSTRKRVKKTFEYRAQVSETATCAGQTSNTEKVKVKKKK
jgi:hypothetical protein